MKKKKKDSPFFSHSLLPDFILVLMYSRTIMRPLLTAKTLRKVILFIKREKRLSRTRREEPKKQMLLVQTRCRGKFSCQLNKELLMKSNSLAFCRPPARPVVPRDWDGRNSFGSRHNSGRDNGVFKTISMEIFGRQDVVA